MGSTVAVAQNDSDGDGSAQRQRLLTATVTRSDGKSTLLNHLFRTTFREMDARQGRNQTTKGIWIAKAVDIDHPCTIVMDLEGNDGSERGEDGKAFERWSALFSLAISDIVMTPFFLIERKLKEEVQKIWNMVPKPRARKEATLDEFFNLRVTALPNYEFQKDQFKEELIELRRKCSLSIAWGGYAKDKQDAVPASALSINMQNIWNDIRKNKDLDIPAYKVLVATARCQEIADELLKVYPFGEIKHYWISRQADIQSFARWVRQVLDIFVQEYDEKTINFDEGVRTTKREYLKARFLNFDFAN
ncbi:hypothetical protein QJS10_CPB15g01849 [Acorus calamus]|uniref:GB1/RHD3-type G domain-containing protein n=1 Tax=Acorus calamus TaxID=4465 RepID=A0AAV9D483_ACOCL|nr:hypothetical protein QJS10_CPB15g01849 [Acorus calamus]